ncbi:DNA-binding death effector domain-containing protein 2 [Bufo bufo]|uniref:DNA-binding death effector domain-containing protein 2 n=1 Tax=Bufo bufo TaxID=8384 RepID=UPI001ABE11FE|nr:DNA-binding death effector domain-containing protein 2 [Bufo bufo]XP_040275739.1 DNA-binding death effector domain-containing protein 2 [Bufo bufo]XP_040275746.1 DNA-binding death effector domain-containing protein 2 [Bufo bufo]
MTAIGKPLFTQFWEEEECLEYYGMRSLHYMFDVIGSHLTDSDVDALSFLLNESYPFTHPLDPNIWTVEEAEEVPGNALLSAWQRWHRSPSAFDDGNLDTPDLQRPKNGAALLLELERRGKCDESNFKHLLQLLRILTRHDLLPYVTLNRPNTVSPERYSCGPSVVDSQMDGCLNSTTSQTSEESWETGSNSTKRKRGGKKNRGHCTKSKKSKVSSATPPAEAAQSKVTCGVRLRVRAEYCRHDAILNQNVLSVKQDPLEKQFDLFSQSNTVLKSRDLGSIICDIKFSELSYLDAFWTDYMNGSLLEALKGVFITDSLKEAVGQETIQLLVNVDEDDYEEGRRLLLENCLQSLD